MSSDKKYQGFWILILAVVTAVLLSGCLQQESSQQESSQQESSQQESSQQESSQQESSQQESSQEESSPAENSQPVSSQPDGEAQPESSQESTQPAGEPGSGASGEKTAFNLDEISKHDSDADCWFAVSGKVYNVTGFIKSHPGGKAIIDGCGKDATTLFETRPMGSGTSHSQNARNKIENYYIGDLIQ
jgi:cytochrome b involved in lipid metabolism